MMEFHISRSARERYQFAESLFSYSGNVIFANLAACREFAYRMNTVREVEKHPVLAVHAGQLYAMGLIDEASHVLMARYREQFDPQVMTGALEWFSGLVGSEALGKMLLTFVEDFPGISVMRGQQTPVEWLAGQTEGTSHWAVAFEELMLLWTANRNEAFQPFEELFAEKSLAEKTVYRQVTRQLPEYFATRPLIPVPDAKPMNLLELLRAPAVGAPRSLSDQLALIRKLWKPLLGDSLERLLAIATEILHEEELAIWMQFNPPDETARKRRESGKQQWPGVVSTADVPVFGDPAHEYEKFSPDQAWMPTAVLIAKSTYVWLAQMSRRYGRWIKRLDEIPDEELATLARRGLNTLWLIGVWERSRASKTIKQLCGNSDAVASAYSLFDYAIAEDLGGEAAYTNLRDRAYKYGIRLASDMVPNHMGIDSPWVIEHPDWFISRPEPPYPVYSFNGPDLSHDGRVEIKIEDHYYEQSDAAVVFQRRDRASGETRYIYHGNDGTSFPWNDTAQLDYLNPAVREQVIQTILHVARLFPVIRFDAAMTLAKRHFHRLWFPGPGSSGAIPSRAEYGMSQAEFDRCMPHEFWREVVDRVAAEVPGTLLLAEAFWLMEGYFVRTLGMHRVYNSAFMVMLRDEENAKYRSVIKNTLEFDPDIMKRYVNFMSNPDERTAIDQFGKGDKCFGVAAMMATLPGLPMFGHGQIEGFTEKYGMEYQRPRYDESPDPWMVERHEREIAPLLKRRRLFAESGSFLLYDFFTDSGKVDENVFAYSNRNGNERALVIFNNRYGETHGTIDYSAAYADKGANQLRQQKISEGLGIGDSSNAVLAWRDSLTGLEYLRRASDLSQRGLTLNLHGYQCHVFLDWRELYSTQEKPWDRLSDQLNGCGVPSLEDALVNLELQPVHDALRSLLDIGTVRLFADLAEHPRTLAVGTNTKIEAERAEFFGVAWTRCESFMRAAQRAYLALIGGAGKLAGELPANPVPTNPGLMGAAFRARLRAAMRIPAVEALFPVPWSTAARRVLPSPSPQLTATAMWGPVLGWCVLELLAESIDAEKPEPVALDLFDRLRLREPFAQVFAALGFEGEAAWRVAARVKIGLLTGAGAGKMEVMTVAAIPVAAEPAAFPVEREAIAPALWPALWLDPDVRWLTGVHSAEGHAYLVREPYEELLWWLLMPSLLRLASETVPGRAAENRAAVERMSRSIEEALATAEAAGYRVDLLMALDAVEAAGEEPAAEVALATDSDAEAVVQAAGEPAAEDETEPELMAEAEAPMTAEVLEAAEPVSGVAVEPAFEAATEAVAEAETDHVGLTEAEPAIEPVADAETVDQEPPEEAESETARELEPVEARSEVGAETAIEPEIESAAEVGIEPDLSTQAEPLPAKDVERVELGIETAVEAAPEPATGGVSEVEAEAESSTAAEPLPAEIQELTEPEDEVEFEPGIEPGIEAVTEAEPTEPGPPAETELVPVEDLEPVAPEIERALESAAESAVKSVAEPEPPAETELVPAREPEPVEIDNLFAVEPAIEPTVEISVDPATASFAATAADFTVESIAERASETEASAEGEPLPTEELDPCEPENKLAVEQASESAGEAAVEQELSAKAGPSAAGKPEPVATENKFAARPASDPRPSGELPRSPDERWEPEAPKIEFVARLAAEASRVAGALHSFTERWEPPAPKVEFAARAAGEANTAAEEPAFHTGRPEPEAIKIEFAAQPATEVRTLAELLHSLNEHWEPPAPKVEFVAKPADELKAEEEAQTPDSEQPKSAEPGSRQPKEARSDPAKPV
jgi:glycosidase